MTTLDTGIHRLVTEAAYHADPAITPSASSGALRALTNRSPLHAYYASPRLNPGCDIPPSSEAQDTGTILHALILERPEPFEVIYHADYRTHAAKEARDAAVAAGRIPLKVADFARLLDIAASIRARLSAMPEVWSAIGDAISTHMTEATLIWRERGVLCRVRYDVLPQVRFRASYDLKFTGKSADPEAFGRTIVRDYLFQAGLYPRAVKALRGDAPEFRFLACETEPPFGVSVHALGGELEDLARRKVDRALAVWERCLRDGVWHGYSTMVHRHDAPAWALAGQDAMEINDEMERSA